MSGVNPQGHIHTPSKMADNVIFLSFFASVFGLRVKIALGEKRVEYEYKEEDLFNKSSLLLKSNPVYKKVPVLIHNGKPICESLAIVEYIDEVWNSGPSLLPQDPYERTTARFWADFTNKVHLCGKTVRYNKGEEREAAKVELLGHLKLLESELGDKPYFNGNTFGYVDIALITFSCWFYTYETLGEFSIEDKCPKLMDWVRRCSERESVSKALPNPRDVFQLNCELKKKLGLE